MLSNWTFCLAVVVNLALFVAVASQKTEHDTHHTINDAAFSSTFFDAWTRPVPLCFFLHISLVLWALFTDSFSAHCWASAFIAVFVFRSFRTVVNTIAYILLKPVLPPNNPQYTNKDVAVIVPTVEPTAASFVECLEKIIANMPAQILIVTIGQDNVEAASPASVSRWWRAVAHVKTDLIVSCDDTVFWPSTLVKYIIAPFEKASAGLVGTCKRVRRNHLPFGVAGFLNLLGVFRLERTNFDLAATWAIDGGMSCVSGRTCAIRTAIVEDPEFQHAFFFLNEYIFWGWKGPLNAGDDKFVTRWIYKKGWEITHQKCPEAQMETILGVKGGFWRYLKQCERWARTSARDNPKMIFRDGVWRTYPWLTYSVLFTSLVDYSLFVDPLIVWLFQMALTDVNFASAVAMMTAHPMLVLIVWMLAVKFIRLAPHYSRHPHDLIYAPGVILFGYLHSVIKLWSLVTCWNIEWGTRAGVDDAAKNTT